MTELCPPIPTAIFSKVEWLNSTGFLGRVNGEGGGVRFGRLGGS